MQTSHQIEAVSLPIGPAAKRLGVSPRTLLRWEDQGKITAERTLGGHRRFTIAELDRVKAEGRSA